MSGLVTSRGDNPCRTCPEHRQPCSDTCTKPEYLAWKQAREIEKKNRREYCRRKAYTWGSTKGRK